MAPLATRIGAMRERLQLQSSVLTKGSDGFSTTTSDGFTTYATVAAEYIEQPTGVEAFEAAAVTAELPIEFRIWYRPDVEPKHRARWRGKTLQIAAVIPVMNVGARFLRLRCSLTQ
jgi:SPP1 family predicted phage head-tail adaptor